MSGLKNFVGNRHGIPTPVQSSAAPAPPHSNRQLAAAQARMPTPVTHLGRPPFLANDRQENPNHGAVAPSKPKIEDVVKVKQEQADAHDDHGGVFDTDAEGVDDTSLLSDLQVKDSQTEDRGGDHGAKLEDFEGHDGREAFEESEPHDDDRGAESGDDEDGDMEGVDDGEASDFEDGDDMDKDEAAVPEDDVTIITRNVRRELEEMRADQTWKPQMMLAERPKTRANDVPVQNHNAPKSAVQYFSKANHMSARGKTQNGFHNTNGSYPVSTSGESDLGNEGDDQHPRKALANGNKSLRPYKGGRRGPTPQPKVVRVPQKAQSQELPQSPQPRHEDVRPRSVKKEKRSRSQSQDLPSNQQHAVEHSGDTDHIDHGAEAELIRFGINDDTDNDNKPTPEPHSQAQRQQTTTLLPEHPPPKTPKRPLNPDTDLDYDPATLTTMPYTTLQTQPFDTDPHAAPTPLPSSLQTARLSQKLSHITTLPVDQRTRFFSGLSLDEWEESGDWFVDRFGELVQRMKDARREKRREAMVFEDEVKRREEVVRRAVEGIQEELGVMRRGGREVLRGKVEGKGVGE